MGTVPRRKSVFQEVGLDDFVAPPTSRRELQLPRRPSQAVRFRSQDDVHVIERYDHNDMSHNNSHPEDKQSARDLPSAVSMSLASPLPTGSSSIMYRIGTMAVLLAAVVPWLQSSSLLGHASLPLQPVSGGPIPGSQVRSDESVSLERRQKSPTDVCFRWAQQCEYRSRGVEHRHF